MKLALIKKGKTEAIGRLTYLTLLLLFFIISSGQGQKTEGQPGFSVDIVPDTNYFHYRNHRDQLRALTFSVNLDRKNDGISQGSSEVSWEPWLNVWPYEMADGMRWVVVPNTTTTSYKAGFVAVSGPSKMHYFLRNDTLCLELEMSCVVSARNTNIGLDKKNQLNEVIIYDQLRTWLESSEKDKPGTLQIYSGGYFPLDDSAIVIPIRLKGEYVENGLTLSHVPVNEISHLENIESIIDTDSFQLRTPDWSSIEILASDSMSAIKPPSFSIFGSKTGAESFKSEALDDGK